MPSKLLYYQFYKVPQLNPFPGMIAHAHYPVANPQPNTRQAFYTIILMNYLWSVKNPTKYPIESIKTGRSFLKIKW